MKKSPDASQSITYDEACCFVYRYWPIIQEMIKEDSEGEDPFAYANALLDPSLADAHRAFLRELPGSKELDADSDPLINHIESFAEECLGENGDCAERESYDTAARLAAIYLERGEPLPLRLNEFAVAVMRGELKRPPRPPGRPREWGNIARDIGIHHILRRLEDKGMQVTKSKERKGKEGFTAIDAVVEVLGMVEYGCALDVGTVTDIWEKERKKQTPLSKRGKPNG